MSTELPSDAPPTRTKGEWGIPEVIGWFVAAYVVTTLVVVAVGSGHRGEVGRGSGLAPRQLVVAAVVLPTTFLLAVAWALRRRTHRPAEEVLQFSDRPGRDLFHGVLIGLGLQVGLALFFSVFRLPSEQGVQDDLKSLVGFQRGAFAAFAAVAAPVAEEMFFRVLLLDALRRRLPVVVAVLAQGLLFGLVHYSSTTAWPVVAALAVVGIVLGTVFARGRSIWTCVAAHMAFNALAVVQLIG